MKKRTLAALAATLLFAVTTVDTFVAPHMAHAQASDATASATAPATAAPQTAGSATDEAVPPPAAGHVGNRQQPVRARRALEER